MGVLLLIFYLLAHETSGFSFFTQEWRALDTAISFETLVSILLVIHLQVQFLDHMVALFLIFGGPSTMFSIVVTLFYIPTNSTQALTSPPPQQHLYFLVFR